MAKKRVADQVVDFLVTNGVKRVYGVAGDSLNGITDSIRARKDIAWAHMRHEEAGAFAAGAEAHLTGTLAVCAGSCGPGNLHLINGLYDCHRSRVPVLAIAAQIPSDEIGSNYFQETDPKHLFAQCSHYCECVSTPSQLPHVLKVAATTAIAKRGVSVVVIPGDVALRHAEVEIPSNPISVAPGHSQPDKSAVVKAAALLNEAKAVTLFAGAGCAEAKEELLELAGRLKAPIVHALRGKEFVEGNNPYDVGMTGLLGFSSGYAAMMSCDAVLLVGTDFPYRQFYPHKAKVIQIDLRGEQVGRRTKVDVGLIGDAKTTLANLALVTDVKTDTKHLDKARDNYARAREGLDDLAKVTESSDIIHPQYLTRTLDQLADDDAVFTCDVGTPTVWAARYLSMNGKRRLIGSFVHGSMAGALPQAIGAQAVDTNRQVIAMCGDGGLAMCLGEIATLRQLNLPVKVIVYRNDSLGFVELEMKAAGFLDYAVELLNPDFGAIARAAGMLGLTAKTTDEVEPYTRQLLAHDGPGLLEVYVNRQELSMPPTITAEQAKGFGVFVLKAVMNGRGDELVDLAATNFLR